MAKTRYGEEIRALIEASKYLEKGGCTDVIPRVNQRIDWLRRNDYDPKLNKMSDYI